MEMVVKIDSINDDDYKGSINDDDDNKDSINDDDFKDSINNDDYKGSINNDDYKDSIDDDDDNKDNNKISCHYSNKTNISQININSMNKVFLRYSTN